MGDIVDGMFQDGLLDWYPDDDMDCEWGGSYKPRAIRCKHCGKTGLRWHQMQHWALVEPSGGLHQCRKPTAAEAFAGM